MDNNVLNMLPEDQLNIENNTVVPENLIANNNSTQGTPTGNQTDTVEVENPVNEQTSTDAQAPAATQDNTPQAQTETENLTGAPNPIDTNGAQDPVSDKPVNNDSEDQATNPKPVDPQDQIDTPVTNDPANDLPAGDQTANPPSNPEPQKDTGPDNTTTVNISAPADDQTDPAGAEDEADKNSCGDHPCDKKWVDNNGTGEKIIITGTDQNDIIHGTARDEDISGRAGDDKLYSGPGDDVLDGEAGNDSMYGCHGDDVYYVDSEGDKVIEFVNQGNDHVFSSISYTLPENVENVHLMTDDDLNAVGNELDNVLHGNDGKNDLSGGAGNDNLYGHAGDDILDGESGADFMVGGEGNDIYYVDQAGDTVVECADEGIDTVLTSISYTAGDHVENLTLLGDDDLNLTGNELNNLLHGNDGNNILLGGDGCDQIFAHDGNDILDGGTGNDLLNGGNGFDTYLFGRGYGNDTIVDYDQAENSNDRISFGSGISASDLEFSRSGGDLVIGLKDSDDTLTISQWFDNADYQIEEFLFNSGDAWSYEQIQEATQALYATVSTNSQLDDIQQQAQTAGSGL